MIVAAGYFLSASEFLAGIYFEEDRVVDLLFPAMAESAVGLERAAFVVVSDEGACLPVGTKDSWIIVE